MEAIRQLRAEVAEDPKAAMRHLKDGVEDKVFDILLKRRSSAASSTLTSVSSDTTSFSSSSSSSRSGESDAVDEQVDEKSAAAAAGDVNVNVNEQLDNGIVYLDKREGTENASSQINGKVDDSGANRTEIREVMTILHGKAVGNSAGAEIASSQINGKVDDDSGAKRTETREIMTILHGKAVDNLVGPSRDEHDETAAADVDLEESDEEVVELEFDTAVQTMHTHDGYNMYCPNCSSQITRVVLRRKIRRRRVPVKEKQPLVGCLSCFSIFTPSGNKLNPFKIFGGGDRDESTQLQGTLASSAAVHSLSGTQDEGTGCNPLWMFKRKKYPENAPEEQREPREPSPTEESNENPREPSPTEESTEKPRDVVTEPGKRFNGFWIFPRKEKDVVNGLTSPLLVGGETLPGPTQPPEHVIVVDTPGVTSSPSAVAQPSLVLPESRSPRSVEIVKSIVYGGLMESMASLSVVSSAAASDSTTLNIVVLGLANLVGGLIVLFHNLKELRYGESDQTDEEIEIRYKKELGKRQHFPLHVFLAVISYFIFGLLPPAIYGSTFRETNDRDYKMLAVAAASLLSIFFLAIGKAYARGERSFTGYFKTVSYYISSAVMVAGISFAVGELAEKFVQQIGWLEPQAPAQVSGIQFQPSWASSY